MTLKDKIGAELTAAMKTRDTLRLEVLRAVKTAIKLRESDGSGKDVDDVAVVQIMSSLVKQRQESVLQFRQGGREDLAKKEEAEIVILQSYLPAQLTEDELKSIVEAAIAESGASSPKDMGKVMKLVTPKTTGRADGKVVSQLVQQFLNR